jgi:molybdopterin converting factor small subunit
MWSRATSRPERNPSKQVLITLRLLGGAKKAVGTQSVNFEGTSASVSEILDFLGKMAVEPRLLQRGNLIVAINGVDSASLGGDPRAVDGDVVTIVPVIHGG